MRSTLFVCFASWQFLTTAVYLQNEVKQLPKHVVSAMDEQACVERELARLLAKK